MGGGALGWLAGWRTSRPDSKAQTLTIRPGAASTSPWPGNSMGFRESPATGLRPTPTWSTPSPSIRRTFPTPIPPGSIASVRSGRTYHLPRRCCSGSRESNRRSRCGATVFASGRLPVAGSPTSLTSPTRSTKARTSSLCGCISFRRPPTWRIRTCGGWLASSARSPSLSAQETASTTISCTPISTTEPGQVGCRSRPRSPLSSACPSWESSTSTPTNRLPILTLNRGARSPRGSIRPR